MNSYNIIDASKYDPENNDFDFRIRELLLSDATPQDIQKFKEQICLYIDLKVEKIIKFTPAKSEDLSSIVSVLTNIKKSIKDLKEMIDDLPGKKKMRKAVDEANERLEEHLSNQIKTISYAIVECIKNPEVSNPFTDADKDLLALMKMNKSLQPKCDSSTDEDQPVIDG